MLRATRNALLVSLAGYGLASVGPGTYERDIGPLGVGHSYVAARRIVGLGMSACWGALFVTADTLDTRNLFLQFCAATMVRRLRRAMSFWPNCIFEVNWQSGAPERVAPTGIPLVGGGTQGSF